MSPGVDEYEMPYVHKHEPSSWSIAQYEFVVVRRWEFKMQSLMFAQPEMTSHDGLTNIMSTEFKER